MFKHRHFVYVCFFDVVRYLHEHVHCFMKYPLHHDVVDYFFSHLYFNTDVFVNDTRLW